ncbi:MAG: hypothetical protein ACRDV1_11660 [Actinomycetes bacterium]
MRVLGTVGSGFVGSHRVAAVMRAGHEVRLLVRDKARVGVALGPAGVAAHPAVGRSLAGRLLEPTPGA